MPQGEISQVLHDQAAQRYQRLIRVASKIEGKHAEIEAHYQQDQATKGQVDGTRRDIAGLFGS